MPNSAPAVPVCILGGPAQCGAYVLQIEVAEPVAVTFGRFQEGRPIVVRPGTLLYAGSAMGQHGSSSLSRRLLRHATRSNGLQPQPIRPILLTELQSAGLGPQRLRPPVAKTAHWHIDYLLDEPTVTLSCVLAVRSERPLEHALVDWLTAQPESLPVAPGLGASDHPGHTHLFVVGGLPALWDALVAYTASL